MAKTNEGISASDALSAEDIMKRFFEALEPFVVTASSGHLSVARDPVEVLELLGQAPGSFRVILAWWGEKPTGSKYSGIVEHEIHVIVSQNRGLPLLKGANLFLSAANPGDPTLTNLVGQVRDLLRGLEFPDKITEKVLTYAGCDPVAVDGTAIDAYTLVFRLIAALPPSSSIPT